MPKLSKKAIFIKEYEAVVASRVRKAGLRNLQQHEVIQLERRGYFRVDQPHLNDSTKQLVLFMIPDSKTKSMGGLTGKLAHH
jgi:hypothetical protein